MIELMILCALMFLRLFRIFSIDKYRILIDNLTTIYQYDTMSIFRYKLLYHRFILTLLYSRISKRWIGDRYEKDNI